MAGKQDRDDGPLVPAIRAALRAIDKIVDASDVSRDARVVALSRIASYAQRRRVDVLDETGPVLTPDV